MDQEFRLAVRSVREMSLGFCDENSRGRRDPLFQSDLELISPFSLDLTALWDSKAGRRLGYKTQVFNSPPAHVRRRAQHTQEVAATALQIAELCGLNRELCQALSFGHDIGHAPYGHLGESVISELTNREFNHGAFGVVVAQEIERKGKGLNLTYETLGGILGHSGLAQTSVANGPEEWKALKISDKISYIFSDINDLNRFGGDEVEPVNRVADQFGSDHRERVWKCIKALIAETAEKGVVSFSTSPVAKMFANLRDMMFERVYSRLSPMRQFQRSMLEVIFHFLGAFPDFKECDPVVLLALLTDDEADRLTLLLCNRPKPSYEEVRSLKLGISEIAPHLRNKQIDVFKPCLDWAK